MKRRVLQAIAALLWVSGCVNAPAPDPEPIAEGLSSSLASEGDRFDESDPVGEPVAHATVTTGIPVSLFPEAEWSVRPHKRMDLDQLEAAFLGVTDGIGWTLDGNPNGKNLFVEFASTLGKPNYTTQTREDLLPGVLFQKFLGDASRQICERVLEQDLGLAPSERILLGILPLDATMESDPVGVEANLSRLLMRFHSREVLAGSTQMNPWRWLFESATHVSGSPPIAWKTVCVGLFTHPDFYSY
jgi:hypothetical protein